MARRHSSDDTRENSLPAARARVSSLALIFACASLLLLATASPAWSEEKAKTQKGTPWETWTTAEVEVRLSRSLRLGLAEQLRFGPDGPYYNRTDLCLGLLDRKGDDVAGVGYRPANLEKNGAWHKQDRVYAYGTLRHAVGSCGIEDVNTFEYQFQPETGGRWRYKNRLAFLVPLDGSKNHEPAHHVYVADEISVELTKISLYRNRVMVGVKGRIVGDLSGDLYYQYQWTRDGHGDEGETGPLLNGICVKLKLSL